MLASIDNVRKQVSPKLDRKRKSQLGQFLTPASIAKFMAELFPDSDKKNCRLLDAGAGVGTLSSAFLDRWEHGRFSFENATVDAFEIDPLMQRHLQTHLDGYCDRLPLQVTIHKADYIEDASTALESGLFSQPTKTFTHAILNPPYKKICSDSRHRFLLRRVGIETVNLYSAFVALATAQLEAGGIMVAIIPRSFCNGPYYRPFREYLLEHAALRHIHLFASRNTAFKDDAVLQENVIVMLERGGKQNSVQISTSNDGSFADLHVVSHDFERIIFPEDQERVIHIPTNTELNRFDHSLMVRFSLDDIGIKASTGPVVDFRVRDHLRDLPEKGAIPLLYPCHFVSRAIVWPKPEGKKPNAIVMNAETEKLLYPNGFYVVTRRLSSKEEKRRIVASVVDPAIFSEYSLLGFENHLNVFHERKKGLPEALAHGLAVFLNSTAVDVLFRHFSGHTQVNATDLKSMKYPSREALMSLGKWAKYHGDLSQDRIDVQVEGLFS